MAVSLALSMARSPRADSCTVTPFCQDIPSKIQTVYQRIQKERKMIEGFRAMAAATGNYDVRASCEAKVRESEKTIQWFEQSLRELQKKQGGDAASVASAGSSGSSSSPYGGGATRPSPSASSSGLSGYSRSESSTSTATQGTSVSSSHRNRVLPPTPGSTATGIIEDSDRSLSLHPQGLPQPAFRDNGVSNLSIRRRGGYTNLGGAGSGTSPNTSADDGFARLQTSSSTKLL